MANQIPFKEIEGHQLFLNEKGEWEECSEDKIYSLWSVWVVSANSKNQYVDEDGYIVYEYLNN